MATAISRVTKANKPKPRAGLPTLGPVRFEGLVDHLRHQITSGVLLPGERLPSFIELQDQFGTSPGTVNRALISLEQDGMVVRERRRGVFVADRKARATQHTVGLAGLDVTTMHSSYWVQLIEGIQSVMHREEMELLLLRPNSTRGFDRIDAVLLHGGNTDLVPKTDHLMPTVSVIEKTAGVPCVSADDFDGARQATQHLLKLGHRKIAFLHYLLAPINQVRLQGYRSAMQQAGIAPKESWIQDMNVAWGDTMRDIGYLRMKMWIEAGWKKTGCTALLCQNDAVAVGVIHALQEAGYTVPADVSVVGYDGTEEGLFCMPHLTTVDVPLREIGALAAEMILGGMRGTDLTEASVALPTKLIVRDSTAPPPASKGRKA